MQAVECAYCHQLSSNRNKTDWTSAIRKSRPGVEGYDLPPLTHSLIGESLKSPGPASVSSRNFDTDVTGLENGLRVASEKLYGEFCTVGGKSLMLYYLLVIIPIFVFVICHLCSNSSHHRLGSTLWDAVCERLDSLPGKAGLQRNQTYKHYSRYVISERLKYRFVLLDALLVDGQFS